jgi:hypothetical protein
MYSLPLSVECGQGRTVKQVENVCVLSDVCVCVDTFHFLFCFVLSSVTVFVC